MAGAISIENGNLVFRLTGVDRALALKSKLAVPLEHVKSVSTVSTNWNSSPLKMLKVAGTRLPRVVVDGRFMSREGLLFYEMRDPNKCITVELSGETYKKVIFEVADKAEAAKMIRQAIKLRLG